MNFRSPLFCYYPNLGVRGTRQKSYLDYSTQGVLSSRDFPWKKTGMKAFPLSTVWIRVPGQVMANLVALRNAWKISRAQNWLELQCSDLMNALWPLWIHNTILWGSYKRWVVVGPCCRRQTTVKRILLWVWGGCLCLTLSLCCVPLFVPPGHCMAGCGSGLVSPPQERTFLKQWVNRNPPFLRLCQLCHHGDTKSKYCGHLSSKQFLSPLSPSTSTFWFIEHLQRQMVPGVYGRDLTKSLRCCLSSDGWTHFGAEQGLCISRFFSDFLQSLPSGLLQAWSGPRRENGS